MGDTVGGDGAGAGRRGGAGADGRNAVLFRWLDYKETGEEAGWGQLIAFGDGTCHGE